MSAAIYIGVDPGKGGGIAAVDETGRVITSVKMPETPRDLLELLWGFDEKSYQHAVIEKVHSSPQMGVASAFTFGKGYGSLLVALTAARIPFDEVQPAGKGFGERDSNAAKNFTKARAQQLFPEVKVTHSLADALLLAEYCRRAQRETVHALDGP